MIHHGDIILEPEESTELIRSGVRDLIIDQLRENAVFYLEIDRFTTPLHLAMAIQKEELQRAVVAKLVTENTGLGTENYEKNTALHLAVANGVSAVITQLLAAGAPVNAAGKNAQSPLHVAISTKEVHVSMYVIGALLAAGADLWRSNEDGDTALHLAIAKGVSAIVTQLLAAGATVNAAGKKGQSPLHRAIAIDDEQVALRVVKALLAAGADVGARDNEHDTALHIAMARGVGGIITELLLSSAPINEAGWDHKYPLHIATTMLDEQFGDSYSEKVAKGGSYRWREGWR